MRQFLFSLFFSAGMAQCVLAQALGIDGAGGRPPSQVKPPSAPQKSGAPAARLSGRLLVEDGSGRAFETYLVDLASGSRQTLPRSQVAQDRNSADRWRVGHGGAGATLLRVDPLGSLAFLDGRRLAVQATISLPSLRAAGLDPEFRSSLPSPDGRMLLGYWRPNGRGKPSLYVITREPRLVESGSPPGYPTEGASHALDWLPDGRYVYLAGSALVVARPGGGIVSRARLDLPAGVDSHGATLKASPDGQHVLLSLERQGKLPLGLLYVAGLDGGKPRLLAEPGERIAKGHVRLSLQDATWSPDGQWVAFVVRGVNPGAVGAYQACRPVRVLPVDGKTHVVDDAGEGGAEMLRLPGESKPLDSCGSLAWLP